MGKTVNNKSLSSLKGRRFDPILYRNQINQINQSNQSSNLSNLSSSLSPVNITPSGTEAIERIRLLMDIYSIPWIQVDSQLDAGSTGAPSQHSSNSKTRDWRSLNSTCQEVRSSISSPGHIRASRSFSFSEPIPLKDDHLPIAKDEQQM